MISLSENTGSSSSEFVGRVRDIFSPEGLLAKAKNFEFRREQQDMAMAVARALSEERHLVVADQRADMLARRERGLHPPQRDPCELLAAGRVTARRELAALVPRGRGLADVVEQRGGADDRARLALERPVCDGGDERLAHQLGVGPDIALGVKGAILHRRGEVPRWHDALEERLDGGPIDGVAELE